MTERTFENFDKLNRKVFADRLTKAITTFSPFYDEAYVLSLNATFGSGKTTFLEMWESGLKTQEYTVVHINAWETDFDDEPIVPIASSLIKEIKKEEQKEKIQAALYGLMGVAILATNEGIALKTGLNIKTVITDIGAFLRGKYDNKIGEKISEKFFQKEEAYRKLKEALGEYSASNTPPSSYHN